MFSDDPDENPAFHDFNIGNIKIDDFCCIISLNILAYVPYCSSDCYTGTKSASLVTNGYSFHGKYIIYAILDDLIKNTWITEAEEVFCHE